MFADAFVRTPTVVLAFFAALAVGVAAPYDPVLTLAAVALIASAGALLLWPDLATPIVIFLFFTNAPAVAVKYHNVPLMVGALLPLALLVPLAYHLSRGERVVTNKVLLLLALFLGIQMLSTMGSRDPDHGWGEIQTFLVEGLLLYFLILNTVRTPALLRRAMWAIVLGAAVLALVSIYQVATGTYTRPYGGFGQVPREFFTGQSKEARLAGPLGDPNYYAQMLLVAVPLGLLSIWTERSALLKSLALGATAVTSAAVMFTFSRGAGVAFVLVLLLMGFLRYIRTGQVLFVLAGIFVLLNFIPAYKDRVETLTTLGASTSASASEGADMSLRSRATEMLSASLVFADHPVLGVGPGMFPSYYQEYANRVGLEVRETVTHGVRRGEEARRESHNMLLSIAADLGAAGLLTFLALIVVTLRELVRARRLCLARRPDLVNAVTAFMLAIVAYVTAGLFLTLAFERYFWLLLALAAAATSVARREAAAAPAR